MSFQEISIAISAQNRASAEFSKVAKDARSMSHEVIASSRIMKESTVATTYAWKEMAERMAITTMAYNSLRREIGLSIPVFDQLVASVGIVCSLIRMAYGVTYVYSFVQKLAASGTLAHAVAQTKYIISTKLAAAATWILNSSLAMKIALLTLGVGLVIATAAYMAWLASATRDAAGAIREYNAALAETPAYTRSIRRRGEEEALWRRGIE